MTRSIAFGVVLSLFVTGCASRAAPPSTPPTARPATSEPPVVRTAAAAMTPTSALVRLFASPHARQAWFAPSFLDEVPFASIDDTIARLRAAFGDYVSTRLAGDDLVVTMERGIVRATARLDREGRFAALVLRAEPAPPQSLDDTLSRFGRLDGKVSVLVDRDGVELGSLSPDAPLAVGSAFKLATLVALRRQIEAGGHAWTDVVRLDATKRSLPSGLLQDWPDGAPLTLYSLAALMVSQSDNTATDALIRLVGRGAIEPFASRNVPYMTTREAFALKSPGNEDLLRRYRAGDVAARRAVLAEAATRPLASSDVYPTGPTAPDVEWFFSTRELCDLMKDVHDLPFMGINPGAARKSEWGAIAYKGGTEAGVINLTTWLERAGHATCVSATWNPDRAIDGSFATAYTALLTWLHDH